MSEVRALRREVRMLTGLVLLLFADHASGFTSAAMAVVATAGYVLPAPWEHYTADGSAP